ncbi:metalloendoproteinase 2-MMP-like protein [Cinnamomum micranthum f. kanehirae]|uniref:Metalloendoproteinase 2-MMP-like protein n=1 Tax=Cinnamomum micranthum f. kanehirae TaxID=337451 RepID=A0A443N3L4_9MAGN|nr:metalloendoproteinase 2-MMP-like protein [Cinnamomum micranthum f. kanehirae]
MKSPAAIAILLLVLVNSVSGFPNFLPKNISSPPWASNILPKNISSPPWASFQNLTGCHMGDHVPGLADLKRYLKRFGYMNFPDNDTNGTNANVTDDFDDSLEWAIKTYQKNFNLNPTGSLDISTVNQIVRPRCGVPDIINGTTTMNSSGAAHANDRRLYSYFPGSPSWPSNKRQLTYAISPADRISADDATLRSIFARAFERWSNVTQLTFVEAAEYSAADIKIGFYSGDHGDGEPFDGVLGTLAHAFSPTSGRFHLDAAETWAADGNLPSAGEIDLESVAVHEIGHLLGLGHSSVEEAIMFPTISSGTRRVELAADDVTGIQLLYGANPNYNASSSSSNSAQEEKGGAASGGGRVVALGFFSGIVSAIVGLLIL